MDQPVPKVSRADVERIVRRDFPAAVFARVLKMLDECVGDTDGGGSRVQLAVLKLANGSEEILRRGLDEAKRDSRDVLGAAEYPGYPWDAHEFPQEERRKIIEADWRQYTEWLYR